MIVGIITTTPCIGGTFLTWSLHYLAGDTELFHAESNEWATLTHNPLTEINSHNCRINHPVSLDEFINDINKLNTIQPTSFHSLYMHALMDYEYTENHCRDYSIHKDSTTLSAIEKMQALSKLIVVELLPSQQLYLSKFEGRALRIKFNDATQFNTSFEEQHDDFINTYFHDDKLKWNCISKPWNYREFLSLNLRPFDSQSIISEIDLTKEHYLVNCFDLFNNLDNLIIDLFSFLKLPIVPDRKIKWLEIYNNWRKLHYDRMMFAEYFDKIINSIINNHYMDLTRFNLDIVREATIQHVLIYKHGLTLKSWGLEKFPNNAQDLHVLLEPNIYHQVDDIYNVLK